MKKQITTLISMLLTFAAFAQINSYDKGFKNGFKEGYCYNDFSCMAPLPPITPLPLIGESSDNYQDGYNRGFKRGLEDKQASKSTSGSNYQQGGQGTYTYTPQQYQSTYVSPNYDLLIKALDMKQAQYEKNEQLKKEKAIGMMNQVKMYYNSLTLFPENINDGWHKVIAMNNYDFCDERKVYVSNNKVTKYVIDDWMEKSISYPSTINKAKAMVQTINEDGTSADMLDLYFLEYINNPNAYTSAPTQGGKISFWTSWKNSGNMDLYFDGMYIAKFTSYFDNGSPSCGQKGTITIVYKPGTYNYRAVAENGWSTKTWEGTINISAGGCQLQGLSK